MITKYIERVIDKLMDDKIDLLSKDVMDQVNDHVKDVNSVLKHIELRDKMMIAMVKDFLGKHGDKELPDQPNDQSPA